MKLILASPTGLIGTEVFHQALSHTSVTSIIGISRRQPHIPEDLGPGADIKKFRSVICEDFEEYSEEVKREVEGADAVIWMIAIPPAKVSTLPWSEVVRISQTFPLSFFKTIASLPRSSSTPLRFVYVSGKGTERDRTKKPWFFGEYSLMRGETETRILALVESSGGKIRACIPRPDLIDDPARTGFWKLAQAGQRILGAIVPVDSIGAALLRLAVEGWEGEGDTLDQKVLSRIGREGLESGGR